MLRRSFFGAVAGLGLASGEAKPNILVILADDLGTGDVGVYNPGGVIKTPNLDRFTRQGMRFTDSHSPSSLCTPTRYALLTGRYAWRGSLKSGVLNGESPNLIEAGRPTIPSVLKNAGYRTGGFGKWHLGLGTAAKTDYSQTLNPSPLDHGFDEYFGIPASLDMPPYLYFDGRRAVEQATGRIGDNGEVKRGPYWRGGPIAPGFKMVEVVPKIGERAERFIRAGSQPYFAYVPLPAPHTPWVPTSKFLGRSRAKLYGDFVAQLDDTIGGILQAAEEKGNTLVVITSDNGAPWEKRDMEENGGHWANLDWRGQKSDAYEGGHRVPFMARWPGKIRAGTISDAPICHTDLFATICGAARVAMPADGAEDSFALQPAFAGKRGDKAVRPHLVHHAGNGMFALREGDWKWVDGLGSGGFTVPAKIEAMPGGARGQLFQIGRDPKERDDLALKEPARAARMAALLDGIRAGTRTRT